MFHDNQNISTDISGWDLSNVTNMNDMFANVNSFNSDLGDWCVTGVTTRPNNFTSQNNTAIQDPYWGYCGRDNLPDNPMILRVSTNGNQYGFEMGNANVLVDWNNGRVDTYSGGNISPRYDNFSGGTRDVRIFGTAERFTSTAVTSNRTTAIISFGDLGLVSLNGAFRDMPQLNAVADLPSTVRSLQRLMQDNETANPSGIENWDVSLVDNMEEAFQRARNMNQNLDNWTTGSVTNMRNMFDDADSFNANISGWDVSNVTNMTGMFSRANIFNQDLSGWCVSNIGSQPNEFNTNGVLASENFPVWGTCN